MPSQVPQDMVLQLCGSYSAAELSPPCPALAELRQAQAAGVSLSLYMEESIQELLHNAAERFKGWMSMPGPQRTELACKKVRTLLPRLAMGPGEGSRAQDHGDLTPPSPSALTHARPQQAPVPERGQGEGDRTPSASRVDRCGSLSSWCPSSAQRGPGQGLSPSQAI